MYDVNGISIVPYRPTLIPLRPSADMLPPVPIFETDALRIVCVSDTHNEDPTPSLPPGDILIHSGDLTDTGTAGELYTAYNWIAALPYKLKIVVAGNHDTGLDWSHPDWAPAAWDLFVSPAAVSSGIYYIDRTVETVAKIKSPSSPPSDPPVPLNVYGNPSQPEFLGKLYAFIYPPFPSTESIAAWSTAPLLGPGRSSHGSGRPSASIWVTHSPPLGRRDDIPVPPLTGCEMLARVVARARPALITFGHYHCSHGAELVRWKAGNTGGGGGGGSGSGNDQFQNIIDSVDVLVDDGKPAVLDFTGEKKFVPGTSTVFVNSAYMTMKKKNVSERYQPIVVTLPVSALI